MIGTTGGRMDATVSTAVDRERQNSLTFEWLYARVQAYTADHRPGPGTTERWSFWIGFAMAGLGLASPVLGNWFPINRVAVVATICLIAELTGLGISLGLMLRRTWPQVVRFRQAHASDMDVDYAKWQSIIAELRRFPMRERASHLRFLISLRQRMVERVGLAFGGVQYLGVFPVLVALYLQFRSWKWGDWAGAFDVNLVAGLLIWAMVLLYGIGWFVIGLRTRLDSYVALLEESLQD